VARSVARDASANLGACLPSEGGLQWLFSPDLAVGTDEQGHRAVFVRAGRVLYSRVERCAIAGAARV
jgi:hypothetical protein